MDAFRIHQYAAKEHNRRDRQGLYIEVHGPEAKEEDLYVSSDDEDDDGADGADGGEEEEGEKEEA